MLLAYGIVAVLCGIASGSPAFAQGAQAPPSFEGKTLTLIIGFEAGGGTDTAGRLLAQFVAKNLSGSPKVNVRNLPGADGLIALNYFVQNAKSDGLTFTMGASTQASPARFRRPQSRYNPAELEYIGGTARGGTVLLINKAAEGRLLDKSAAPVAMGSLGGMPRSGMLTTAWGIEFLGWNAKWVLGYRGTNDLMIALERGEIDMTSTGNRFLIDKLLATGRFSILTQSGQMEGGRLVGRPDFGAAPIFPLLVETKISDPEQLQSFRFWSNLTSIDKWLALPPRTPEPIILAYREAFSKIVADEEFLTLARKISDDLEPQNHADVSTLIHAVASTTDGAILYIQNMLKRQGLNVTD